MLFQNNQYAYDLVGNILSIENAINHQPSTITQLGGSSKYAYEYDELNRLIKAKGQFEGTSNKADYELNMQYNRLNGIVQKALQYTLNGQDKGYTLDYKYDNKNHPHAPSSIAGLPSFGGAGGGKPRNYQYDGNGNPVSYDEFKSFRSMVWDEENRLRGINDNGRLHLYTYDHTGERALKSSAESSMAVINGATSAIITHTEDYTAYVSPYFVVNKGKFTKHYFEGSSRVVSKLGEGTFVHKNTGIMAGGIDYIAQSAQVQTAIDQYIRGLQVPPGPPTQHGIYASPEWTGNGYPSIDWQAIAQNQEPPEGWPRPPKFNDLGDVPGPPVQFGPPVTNANVKAGFNFISNGVEEKNLYFYHPDHLGSSSYITDREGQVIQHTEYIAFGETFVDEHSTNPRQPYLFNGKELDFETGLYYYGARYYDPKTSIWLNVDPLVKEERYFDDEDLKSNGGGIFNPLNYGVYSYTYNNPVMLTDPDGKCPTCIVGAIVGAVTDYGIQVASNYMNPNVKNKWTDNISLSSIALSAAEGAVTQGGSALRKVAIKGAVMVVNNSVDYNTSDGLKVETNVGNIVKNTTIDAVTGGASSGVGSLAKTSKLNKIADKTILSNSKSKKILQSVGLSSKEAYNITKKAEVKNISKQFSKGIKNLSNKTIENSTNAYIKQKVDDFKKQTDR